MQHKQAANSDTPLKNMDMMARRIVSEAARHHERSVTRILNMRPRQRQQLN